MTLNFEREFDCKEREKAERYVDRLFDASYTALAPLSGTAYVSSEPLSFKNRFDGKRMELSEGDVWAKEIFDCAWFHLKGKLPDGIGLSNLALLINCGGEGLICGKNGEIIQSITCCASDFCAELGVPVKRVVPLCDEIISDGYAELWIDCAANDLFGNMKNESRASELSIAVINHQIRALAYDLQVLLSAYDFGSDADFKSRIWSEIEKLDLLSTPDEKEAEQLRKTFKPLLEEKNDGETFTYTAVGHAHLDLAWLWPLRESKRKGARTFSSQIKNIELYPDYVFGASQAQLYEWVKDGYPEIYKKVKALAATPSWDVQGATWVEMDSNLIGSESMVRQFFYGKKFFMDEFGQEMKIFWVPDSFGYSACLPQVMKLANVPYFLTQKISWCTYNKFPYHSFYWRGLDGSEVLAHMLPEDTYNSPMRADFLAEGERNYRERAISDEAMILYGIGDGGAGPGYEHIERARRYNDLKGLPKVKMAKSTEFFKSFDNSEIPYPTYSGELYLEKHQGTYTTQSNNKRSNRRCEFALRNYEMAAVLAGYAGIDAPISHDELERIWKEVLLYQFHDILPGSSIDRVYEETAQRYSILLNRLENSARRIYEQLGNGRRVINTNSFTYNKCVQIGKKWYRPSLLPFSVTAIRDSDEITEFCASCGYDFIENDCVKVSFKDGCISSIYDKGLCREFITPDSKAAVISQYTDNGDCWDMPKARADYIHTKRDALCTFFEVKTNGACAIAMSRFEVGDCIIVQKFKIYDGDNAVYCKMDIDCHQQSSMLRIAFPVNVNTEECSFNLQFGHLKRRTTENNSVEIAQYEVSGQKFVDMSDDKGGISFINDSKYGYRCKHGVIDLNLVRSPKDGPGTNVDQGKQTVNYALMPHKGQLSEETYAEAYYVNNPPVILEGDGCCESVSYCSSGNEAVILESIKQPEDGRGVIARFYNCTEASAEFKPTINGLRPTYVTDILENDLSKADNSFTLHGFGLINIRFE